MPVHLGSMGQSVETVIDANRETMKPGDVYVLNAPYHAAPIFPTSPS